MAYTNSISLASKYLPILDEQYKAEAKSSVLEASNDRVKFIGANTIELFKISMDGLGNYDRNTGYPTGSVTGTWEQMQLTKDRAKALMVDRMDDEETLGMAFGSTLGQFQRTQVIPELDAYRFAKLAGTANIFSANADITVGTTDIPQLIADAEEAMGDAEVPEEGRILFVSEKCYNALKAKITRKVDTNNPVLGNAVEYYDDMRVIKVPKGRFNTAITLGDNGFTVPASTSYPINFMIVHPSAVVCVTKLAMPKIFSPDENQNADAWSLMYRTYHDIFVEANKVKGIYLHRASTANS